MKKRQDYRLNSMTQRTFVGALSASDSAEFTPGFVGPGYFDSVPNKMSLGTMEPDNCMVGAIMLKDGGQEHIYAVKGGWLPADLDPQGFFYTQFKPRSEADRFAIGVWGVGRLLGNCRALVADEEAEHGFFEVQPHAFLVPNPFVGRVYSTDGENDKAPAAVIHSGGLEVFKPGETATVKTDKGPISVKPLGEKKSAVVTPGSIVEVSWLEDGDIAIVPYALVFVRDQKLYLRTGPEQEHDISDAKATFGKENKSLRVFFRVVVKTYGPKKLREFQISLVGFRSAWWSREQEDGSFSEPEAGFPPKEPKPRRQRPARPEKATPKPPAELAAAPAETPVAPPNAPPKKRGKKDADTPPKPSAPRKRTPAKKEKGKK